MARDHIRKLQPILAFEWDSLHVSFPICLVGSVRNFSDRGNEPTIHRADVDIQRTTAKRTWSDMSLHSIAANLSR